MQGYTVWVPSAEHIEFNVCGENVVKYRHHKHNRQTADHLPLFVLRRTNDRADVWTDEQNQVIIIKQITETVTTTGQERYDSVCETGHDKTHMRGNNKQTKKQKAGGQEGAAVTVTHTVQPSTHLQTCTRVAPPPLYFPAIIPFQRAGRWLLTADSTSSFQMDCFCEITSLS